MRVSFKGVIISAIIGECVLIAGCYPFTRPPPALIVTDINGPVGSTTGAGNPPFPHVSGPVINLFGLIAWGDASITTAREQEPR